MPRKRQVSLTFYDDEDLSSDSKCGKDDSDSRAPRNAANARERARMRVLSKAFCRLKTTLPWVPADTKLSKLDTLRLAATYIAHLRAVLRDDADVPDSTRSLSLTLSWPFALQNVTPALTSNNCNVSSTSICPNSNQYSSQHQYHESQNYDINNYQNANVRQSYDNQIEYY